MPDKLQNITITKYATIIAISVDRLDEEGGNSSESLVIHILIVSLIGTIRYHSRTQWFHTMEVIVGYVGLWCTDWCLCHKIWVKGNICIIGQIARCSISLGMICTTAPWYDIDFLGYIYVS